MNNVLFAKVEDNAPELFGEEWQTHFATLFNREDPTEFGGIWDVFYFALVLRDGEFVPAPFIFDPEHRDEDWAVVARRQLGEWLRLPLDFLTIEWIDRVGWKATRPPAPQGRPAGLFCVCRGVSRGGC